MFILFQFIVKLFIEIFFVRYNNLLLKQLLNLLKVNLRVHKLILDSLNSGKTADQYCVRHSLQQSSVPSEEKNYYLHRFRNYSNILPIYRQFSHRCWFLSVTRKSALYTSHQFGKRK